MDMVHRSVRAMHLDSTWQNKNITPHPILQKFDLTQPNAFLQDVEKIMGDQFFEVETAKIPGQSSGLSTRYFYMLIGNEGTIKPDRMVRRFVFDVVHRVNADECQELLSAACVELAKEFPTITPRSLDHQIWLYQRGAVNE